MNIGGVYQLFVHTSFRRPQDTSRILSDLLDAAGSFSECSLILFSFFSAAVVWMMCILSMPVHGLSAVA